MYISVSKAESRSYALSTTKDRLMVYLVPGTLQGRERESAQFHEHKREVRLLNPVRDKNERKYRGGEGKASVTTATALV